MVEVETVGCIIGTVFCIVGYSANDKRFNVAGSDHAVHHSCNIAGFTLTAEEPFGRIASAVHEIEYVILLAAVLACRNVNKSRFLVGLTASACIVTGIVPETLDLALRCPAVVEVISIHPLEIIVRVGSSLCS